MPAHDTERYVNLDSAMEVVKSLRDPAQDHLGAERPGWVAAINWVLGTLDKLPTEQVMRYTINHGDD